MIVGLSEILRRATDDFHEPETTLAEEVEYLQRYVDIQKVRFGDRLRYEVDVPEALMDAPVPGLMLQPLVENAFKHGLAERVAGGAIQVTARAEDGVLRLRVRNDGPGLASDWDVKGSGVGLRNLRTRLRIMHGDEADLRIETVEGGVEVTASLPWRPR